MLSENPDNQHRAEWQRQLQQKLGGVCAARLHVTCQQLHIEEPAARNQFCHELKPALRSLKKFTVYGRELTFRHSEFRSYWILKCHSPLTSPLREAFATIDSVALKHDARLAYERSEDSSLITV